MEKDVSESKEESKREIIKEEESKPSSDPSQLEESKPQEEKSQVSVDDASSYHVIANRSQGQAN